MSLRTAVVHAVGLATLLAGAALADPAPSPDCVSWPGELEPLATVSDPDLLRAQWAQLRSAELARVAAWLEAEDGPEAERMWRHALCLDPGNPELARGAERAAAIAHRPSKPPKSVPAYETAAVAAKPLPPVGSPPPPDPCRTGAEACPRLREVDRALERVDSLVRRARFDEALAAERRPRTVLNELPASSATRRRRVQLETLAATAHVALGQHYLAEKCFDRALEAEPKLRLDGGTTSPKVVRVLEGVRGQHAARSSR
jgi:hypothetical protein